MQQIDISAHIEKLLFEHETLIVPTFGGFTSTRSAAAVDFVGGAVAPPSKTLSFNENLTVDDGILVHDISSTHNLSNDDARQAILDFVDKTKDALNQREIVNLPGIGRLYKNYAQKIQFLPDTTNFNTDSFGLPPLQFSPLGRARETAAETMPAATGSAAPTNGAAATPPPVAAPEASQAAAATVATPPPAQVSTAVSQTVAPPPVPRQPVVERTRPAGANPMRSMSIFIVGLLAFSTVVAVYLMKRSRDAKLAAAQQESVVETREEPTNAILPTPGNMIAEAEKAAEATQKAENEKLAKKGIEDENKNDDTADEVEEAAAKRTEAASTKEKPSKKTTAAEEDDESSTSKDGKRCVLVIGTFKDKANSSKLLDKLRSKGYDTYYRLDKGHQVGIEFFYKDVREIQAKIHELEKLTGETDIWIKRK